MTAVRLTTPVCDGEMGQWMRPVSHSTRGEESPWLYRHAEKGDQPGSSSPALLRLEESEAT